MNTEDRNPIQTPGLESSLQDSQSQSNISVRKSHVVELDKFQLASKIIFLEQENIHLRKELLSKEQFENTITGKCKYDYMNKTIQERVDELNMIR